MSAAERTAARQLYKEISMQRKRIHYAFILFLLGLGMFVGRPIGVTTARNMKNAEAQKTISANGTAFILRATDDGALSTTSAMNAKTTSTLYLTVPSGFTLIDSGTGVRLYKKNYVGGAPDYVTVINLGQATLRNLTGSVSGSNVYRKSLSSFWADMADLETSTRKRMLVVNGTFFATNNNPAGIAFGLKRNYRVISYGYGLQEYPGKIKTLAWGEWGPASINLYSKSTFDGNWSDVVGGLDETVDKSKYSRVPRTFAGIRDDDGNGYVETVFLYSSSYATQSEAANVLRAFGASSVIMLDGGGSTGLILRGTSIISPIRTLPHAIGVFTGK
jgi:hypothetical protein